MISSLDATCDLPELKHLHFQDRSSRVLDAIKHEWEAKGKGDVKLSTLVFKWVEQSCKAARTGDCSPEASMLDEANTRFLAHLSWL